MDQLDHPKEAIELPLKFEDIVDKTTYDKMRPPKPGGKLFIEFKNSQTEGLAIHKFITFKS